MRLSTNGGARRSNPAKPGQTHDLPVARLIAGWQEALSLMKEGDELIAVKSSP